MYDFSKQLSKFHEGHVRLTKAQYRDMRDKREKNLDRMKKGLEEMGKPPVAETINQGGYAQYTMTQPPENDQESRYDIDLGVVFEEEDAAGPRTVRNWVRDAITCKATNMKYAPESKKKCVRVVYSDGYQCDFPVFRRQGSEGAWKYELSSGDEWQESDPAAINKWIEAQVSSRSPETSGSYQLRRIIRFGKFYSKTHAKRLNRKFPGGLVATALFVEAYVPIEGRDDQSFYETLRALSYRWKHTPVFANGVLVSDDKDIDRIGRLIEQAETSVKELDKLQADEQSEAVARSVWKKIFRHSFFDEIGTAALNSESPPLEKKSALGGAAVAGAVPASQAVAALSDSEKQARMEASLNDRRESGGGGKPWSA
jgi:hypothetical protein